MTYTRSIQIRLSRDQFSRIKADCHNQGFNSVSSYIRYLALGSSRVMEEKIFEIHRKIMGREVKRPVNISKLSPFVTT